MCDVGCDEGLVVRSHEQLAVRVEYAIDDYYNIENVWKALQFHAKIIHFAILFM